MTDSEPDLGLPDDGPDEIPEPAEIGFEAIGDSLPGPEETPAAPDAGAPDTAIPDAGTGDTGTPESD